MEITEDQIDILKELVNIGVGRSAASLSDLIETRINLRVPNIQIMNWEDASAYLGRLDESAKQTTILQDFKGQIQGRAGLVFSQESAIKFAQILSGDDSPTDELDIELSGIIMETGNIVLNGIMGSLGNAVDVNLEYTVPALSDKTVQESILGTSTEEIRNPSHVMIGDAEFSVADRDITGSIMIVFELGCLEIIFQLMSEAA